MRLKENQAFSRIKKIISSCIGWISVFESGVPFTKTQFWCSLISLLSFSLCLRFCHEPYIAHIDWILFECVNELCLFLFIFHWNVWYFNEMKVLSILKMGYERNRNVTWRMEQFKILKTWISVKKSINFDNSNKICAAQRNFDIESPSFSTWIFQMRYGSILRWRWKSFFFFSLSGVHHWPIRPLTQYWIFTDELKRNGERRIAYSFFFDKHLAIFLEINRKVVLFNVNMGGSKRYVERSEMRFSVEEKKNKINRIRR